MKHPSATGAWAEGVAGQGLCGTRRRPGRSRCGARYVCDTERNQPRGMATLASHRHPSRRSSGLEHATRTRYSILWIPSIVRGIR